MEKVIKDGKVAVCISRGYGAGWSTWGAPTELIFHPTIVDMVLAGKQNDICSKWLVQNFGPEYADIFCGGVTGLTVEWIPEGTKFRIAEYDGYESIVIFNEADYITA